jgi:hypothetical protein
MQTPLEATLTEEEARRNSTRIDMLYMLSSHPLAPDVFEIADAASGTSPDQLAALARPIAARLSGTVPVFLPVPVRCRPVFPPVPAQYRPCLSFRGCWGRVWCFSLLYNAFQCMKRDFFNLG